MSKRLCLPVLVLLLSLIGTSGSSAQEHRNIESDVLAKMESEGWNVVKHGVLQRELRAGEVETFAYGVEGFRWKLQDLRNQLRDLRAMFQANPTPELRKVIRNHRKQIASTLAIIERARAAEARGLPGIAKGSCTFDLAFNADAGPRTDVQGTWASASSSFSASPECNYFGEVYARAEGSVWVNGSTTTQLFTDGYRYGSNVSASASVQLSGGSPCNSSGFSSVTSYTPNPQTYYKQVDNNSCTVPPPPLQVSVTSTHASSLTLYTGICLQISWSVSTSNGTPAYATKIYLNNVFKKNGTTYWEWICAPAPGVTQTYTLRADVTDSLGNTGSGSHTTTITGQ
jgi:hypothetical protein